MKETGLFRMADSNPVVMLTQGQLREMIRQAVESAMTFSASPGKHETNITGENSLAHKTYLSVAEAAKLTGLGTSTIRLCIRRGELKCNKVHRRRIISRAELEKLIGAARA